MKWTKGRQSAVYYKCKIFKIDSRIFISDCYLLKFDHNCTIPEHVDLVPNKKHFRLNIIYRGSVLIKSERNIFSIFNRIYFFRPDLSKHSLFNSNKELRMFSLGFAF